MMTTFDPPGPGGWKRLADHFPAALTAEYQLLYAEAAPPAMAAYMARYGVLARSLAVEFVHGHLYVSPVPVVGSPEPRLTPPAWAVWLVSRLHPSFVRRNAAARRALAGRPWRAVAERWFAVERAEWVERNAALAAEEPATLDDAGLAAHLERCRAHAAAGYRRHFELHGDDLLPVGLLLVRAVAWGIAPEVAAAALRGASPLSGRGAVAPPDWQLVTGYDLDSLAWCELGAAGPPPDRDGPAVVPVDLRPLVPPADHAELDELLADARAAVPLRDDNGALTGAWPLGLLRRAMLEAGRRVGLAEPAHGIELTVAELAARLRGAPGPTGADAAERAARRRRDSQLDAPLELGPEFAIPPLAALPRPLARIGAAQLATADHMLGRGAGAVAIGDHPHTGRVLVVDDPSVALDLIEPGDVVVTRSTSPSWNVVLTYAGALVATTGGVLSHAAVIARELGIPALVGAAGAAERLRTGMIVTVDPRAATVVRVPDTVTA